MIEDRVLTEQARHDIQVGNYGYITCWNCTPNERVISGDWDRPFCCPECREWYCGGIHIDTTGLKFRRGVPNPPLKADPDD